MGRIKKKETTYVDSEGRQSTTVTEIEIDHSPSEPFYQVYLNYIGWQFDIHGGAAQAVLVYFMENAEYNTGLVRFTASDRKELMERIKVSRAGLYKAIKYLEKVGAIAPKVCSVDGSVGGQYMINPNMFWKGDKSTRQSLRVTFRAVGESEMDSQGFPVQDVEHIKG